MKLIPVFLFFVFLVGCTDNQLSDRIAALEKANADLAGRSAKQELAIEAQNKTLAAQSGKLLLEKAPAQSRTFEELTARIDRIAEAQQRADNKISRISESTAKADSALAATIQLLFDQQVKQSSSDSLMFARLSRPDLPAACDFFSPELSTLKTPQGFLFYVMPQKIEPMDGGTMLRFQIGNPSAAQFDGAIVTMVYGAAPPKTKDWFEGVTGTSKADQEKFAANTKEKNNAESAWRNSLKVFSTTRQEKLAVGSWTEMAILVPDAKLAELRYVELSLSVTGVSLAKEKR